MTDYKKMLQCRTCPLFRVAENLVKEGVGSMYKILFLVTAYNVMTGTIEQILANSLEEARQMPYVPARWIDRISLARSVFALYKGRGAILPGLTELLSRS